MYKTKTQKKNALESVEQKAKKLYMSGVISVENVKAITRITKNAFNKL